MENGPASQPRSDVKQAIGYTAFLADVKARITTARTRAVLAVNSELIRVYWEIGRKILARHRGCCPARTMAAAIRKVTLSHKAR